MFFIYGCLQRTLPIQLLFALCLIVGGFVWYVVEAAVARQGRSFVSLLPVVVTFSEAIVIHCCKALLAGGNERWAGMIYGTMTRQEQNTPV